MAETDKEPGEATSLRRVSFDYLKSNQHRVVYVTGAHGGPTASLRQIAMSLFNERPPIVQRETFAITSEGKLGERVERLQRDAIVREVEVTVLLDIGAARAVATFLNQAIEKAEAALGKHGDGSN